MRGLRRTARVARNIAAVCLLVVAAVAVARLLASAPSDATKQDLTVAQLVVSALGVVAAVSSVLLARSQARSGDDRLADTLTPQLLADERLVNRDVEMRDLVARLDDSRAVGCHGPRGAGKSFLLEHLTDVINGHRPQSAGQPRPKRVAAAMYFDLADAIGFPEAQAQICSSVLGDPTATWSDFAACVERTFKRRRVLLILDNVNSEGIWRQLGQAAHRYCAVRPNDRVVFGSIDPVALSNLAVAQVEVLGLDLDATETLVATRGIQLEREQLVALHDDSRGLPFYVPFFTGDGSDVGSKSVPALSDRRIVPDLAPETRRLVAHTALLALVTRRIGIADLRVSGVADLEQQLHTAERRLLVSPVPDGKDRRYKIHDIARDAVLRELGPDVAEAALTLFERAHGLGNSEHAALFAMFVDPDEIDTGLLDGLLEEVIHSAVRSKNYALISSLHTRAAENAKMMRFRARQEARADLFSFARTSELAGLGRYEEAEEELLTSSVVRTRWHSGVAASDLQADLRFMQADVAHLLNRYDESALIFEELAGWAAGNDRRGLEARCVWGHGHVLRHQGRDFDLALMHLERAALLADEAGELFAKAYAVCNANGIKLLVNAVPDDQEQRLSAVELEVAGDSAHSAYLLEVWKTQAQLAWWRGDRRRAADIVDAAIDRALELNDRLLYNLYFERAEFERLTGAPERAITDYRAVLQFGRGNRDRNLVSQALLGLVLAEITEGRWLYHAGSDEARATLLRARQTASDADIQLTVHLAEQVSAMLDAEHAAPEAVRLFLL